MGQPNDAMNYYLQRQDRMAAICNYCVGEKLFTPDDFTPADGFYAVRSTQDKITHIQRDILRQAEIRGQKILVGIENQNDKNLIFPFRQMEMDYLEIRKQIKQIQEKNKNTKTDDFMYSYKKTDKLVPIMNFVLYWGKEPWEEPRSLIDMQDIRNLPKELEGFLSEYRINIVSLREIPDEELDKMESDIGCVIGLIKHSQSQQELRNYIEEHKENFTHFSKSAADVVDACVGIRGLRELIKFQKSEGREEEGNMCQAIDDLIRISTNDGITKGKAEAVIELLELRGTVSQETKNKINSESSLEILKQWLVLAASVKSVEEFCVAM